MEIEECFVACINGNTVAMGEQEWISAVDSDIILKEVSSLIRRGWPTEKKTVNGFTNVLESL